jgi:thioredoxin reductase
VCALVQVDPVAITGEEFLMHDLIIIGGGAAALAAATYALGKRLDVVMVYEHLGGKSGWRQNLTGQEQPEDLPGEEAARLLERRVSAAPARLRRDRVVAVQRVAGGFAVDGEQHGRCRRAR